MHAGMRECVCVSVCLRACGSVSGYVHGCLKAPLSLSVCVCVCVWCVRTCVRVHLGATSMSLTWRVTLLRTGRYGKMRGGGLKFAHWMFGFQRNGQEWIIRQMELANRLSYAAIDGFLFPGVGGCFQNPSRIARRFLSWCMGLLSVSCCHIFPLPWVGLCMLRTISWSLSCRVGNVVFCVSRMLTSRLSGPG